MIQTMHKYLFPNSFGRFFRGALLTTLLTCLTGTAGADDEELKIAPPEQVTMTTADGVELHATWYAGGVSRSEKGLSKVEFKNVVPIIIVHGWDESSNSFSAIASYLQILGHAVIVPDLRGHGRTKLMRGTREIKRDDFSANDMAGIALGDLVAVKKFLLQKNNAKQLNIELLTVIGSEEGSIVAANWVLRDWSLIDLINRKQGKDVKAIVLLSPLRTYNGYHWNDAMKQPVFSGLNPAVFTIPMLIIVGKNDDKAYREAKTIYSRLSTSRKRLHQSFDEEERRQKQTLYLVERDTELQGERLLDPRLNLNLHLQIKGFIDYKVAAHASEDFYKWTDRDY